MRKKILVILILFVFISLNFIGCGGDDKQEQTNNEIKQLKSKIIKLEKENKEIRAKKNKAVKEASDSKSSRALLIGISIAVGLLVFLIGIGIGSKASSDYKKQMIKEKQNGKDKKSKKE